MPSLICGILKKGYNELLSRIDTDSQTLKILWFPKVTGWRDERDGLGVWDGNPVKLGCDDCCTTINVIKYVQLKKKKNRLLTCPIIPLITSCRSTKCCHKGSVSYRSYFNPLGLAMDESSTRVIRHLFCLVVATCMPLGFSEEKARELHFLVPATWGWCHRTPPGILGMLTGLTGACIWTKSCNAKDFMD